MAQPYRNILVTRTDRIGDVILSLPVAAAIKDAWPGATVTFLVREAVEPIARMCPWIDEAIVLAEGEGEGEAALTEDLRRRRFDVAICLYPRSSVATLLKKARIPVRVGSARRLFSLRFTHRVNISRASGGKHERDFNLDLLRGVGLNNPQVTDPVCQPPADALQEAEQRLRERGLSRDNSRPIILVHPGCGGSAPNWSTANYRALCQHLVDRDLQVVLSGSSAERRLIDEVRGGVSGVVDIAGATTLPVLAAIMHHADLFIGPSTGPMHLAAAVRCPVIALFGPIRTTTPDRWGPLGDQHVVFAPDVPECNCKVDRCKLGDCMERIAVQSVGEKAAEMAHTHHRTTVATHD